MLSARQADTVMVWAPAKVNLFLEVLAKRPDGYHDIATLMVAVSLYDTLEFKEDATGSIRLECDQPDLPTGPDNLVCRAAELLRQRCGVRRGARIHLSKRIPLAAGLAGGSSDAAAALAGLNELWALGLSPGQLAGLGADIGSDVPFFFATPAAWCTGRGERVTPVSLGRALQFVLVCPPVGLSTAEVYRGVTVPADPFTGTDLRSAVAAGDMAAVGRCLHNRLQPPAERLCGEVAHWRRRLADLHPAGQLMSGSGSCVFALCHDHQEALRVARQLHGLPDAKAPGTGAGGLSKPRLFLVRSCV
jgi:4-diphosphocytidyl-2-C-methyl-D-erythritol kinase